MEGAALAIGTAGLPRSGLQVGLIQINNSFSGQNYLPHSIALLQSYVRKFAAATNS
jgi:hypothetical protein